MKEFVWDMRVRTITKVEKDKEDGSTTVYKMVARDKEGLNEIVITSSFPFPGLNAKAGVVQVKVGSSQMSISDFKPVEKPKIKGAKKEE